MSCVGVCKWFTSLSEIERKFFVFVGILEMIVCPGLYVCTHNVLEFS